MNNPDINKIIEKIRVGDGLSDEQLNVALDHYTTLCSHLKPHGQVYHLVYSHACRILEDLQYFKKRRSEH